MIRIKLFCLAATAAMALAAVPSLASEATFDRTLTVSGRVELSVSTGSGNIRLTHGTGNQVHIFGRVKAGRGGFEENVNATAAHPPIEQTGNIIRVGSRHPTLHNMSIDYEIQAPENAYLDVSTVSGDVDDDGVGDNAKLNTGSGNIHATGLHGGFTVGTGSGNIYAEQTSQGDVKAETGSGNIELRNLRGGLKAETGSGNIKLGGAPTAPWRIETGSGGVDFWAGNAALTLEAETDSGSIHTDRELAGQESSDRHHVTGKLNGGGPTVKIGSGSGNIRIH
jgi:DUF4097 and DUF4098 domain-containing protein YvlB